MKTITWMWFVIGTLFISTMFLFAFSKYQLLAVMMLTGIFVPIVLSMEFGLTKSKDAFDKVLVWIFYAVVIGTPFGIGLQSIYETPTLSYEHNSLVVSYNTWFENKLSLPFNCFFLEIDIYGIPYDASYEWCEENESLCGIATPICEDITIYTNLWCNARIIPVNPFVLTIGITPYRDLGRKQDGPKGIAKPMWTMLVIYVIEMISLFVLFRYRRHREPCLLCLEEANEKIGAGEPDTCQYDTFTST